VRKQPLQTTARMSDRVLPSVEPVPPPTGAWTGFDEDALDPGLLDGGGDSVYSRSTDMNFAPQRWHTAKGCRLRAARKASAAGEFQSSSMVEFRMFPME
jgi:hypothetical protein